MLGEYFVKHSDRLVLVASFTLFVSCSGPKMAPQPAETPSENRSLSSDAQAPSYAFVLDKEIGEYLVPDEADATNELLKLFKRHMKKKYEDKKVDALRAVHAKSHGCLTGQFEVLDHGDAALKFGIFASPGKFPVFVRYSNGDGPPQNDSDDLVSLGMAFKVMDVSQPKLLASQREDAQDFLMINQPAFLVKDIVDFAAVIRAREGGFIRKGVFAIKHHDALSFRKQAHPKSDPLNTTFWSALAFRLGDHAVKYLARPCNPRPKTVPAKLTADYITGLLKTHLETDDGCFDFFLQKRLKNGKEDVEMPIENARTIWDEEKSVPVKVARLWIPKQAFDSVDRQKECEQTEFSPWNTTKDFHPLGNLNRIRKLVYEFSAGERHRLNRTDDPFSRKKP